MMCHHPGCPINAVFLRSLLATGAWKRTDETPLDIKALRQMLPSESETSLFVFIIFTFMLFRS